MSRTCQLCGKKANTARNVSHAQNKTTKIQRVNLKSVTVSGVKLNKVCPTCRRTLNKQAK